MLKKFLLNLLLASGPDSYCHRLTGEVSEVQFIWSKGRLKWVCMWTPKSLFSVGKRWSQLILSHRMYLKVCRYNLLSCNINNIDNLRNMAQGQMGIKILLCFEVGGTIILFNISNYPYGNIISKKKKKKLDSLQDSFKYMFLSMTSPLSDSVVVFSHSLPHRDA